MRHFETKFVSKSQRVAQKQLRPSLPWKKDLYFNFVWSFSLASICWNRYLRDKNMVKDLVPKQVVGPDVKQGS